MNLVAACPYALSLYYRDDMETKRGTRTMRVCASLSSPTKETSLRSLCCTGRNECK